MLALGLVSLALAPAAAGASCVPPSHTTVAYRTVAGVARDLTSLDLYVPPKRCRRRKAVAPVVVWVHGGGYRRGDKAQQVADKVALFAKRGWIFASVNYRLSRPAAGNARYPDHYNDVASAVAWLREHVRGRGGDPSGSPCSATRPAPTS